MRLKLNLLILLCGFLTGGLHAQVIDEAPAPPPPPEEEIFKVVEEMPRFPGCEDKEDTQARKLCAQQAMLQYVYKNITYPKTAKDNGVEGMAVIRFNVKKDGSLDAINILRDPGAGLGQAAADVIHKMNNEGLRWIPGRQSGQAVVVQFNLPVRFKLAPEDRVDLEEPIEEDETPVFTDQDVEEDETPVFVDYDVVEEAPPIPISRKRKPRTTQDAPPRPVEIPASALDPNDKDSGRMAAPPPPPPPPNWEPEIEIDEAPPAPEVVPVAPPPPPPPPPPPSTGGDIFKVVEEMPRYKTDKCEAQTDNQARKTCAQEAMLAYVYKNLQYPDIAKENGVEGTCVITFVVKTDGSLDDIRIVRDIGAQCGREAERVINTIAAPGTWVPGKQRGRLVAVQYNLPVRFKLPD